MFKSIFLLPLFITTLFFCGTVLIAFDQLSFVVLDDCDGPE